MYLYELAYISTAALNITEADVSDIIEQSKLSNSLRDISGVLVFNGINFAQILEGRHSVIEDLFESICNDTRHTGVIRIAASEIEARSFAGWSMRQLKGEGGLFGQHTDLFRQVVAGAQPQKDEAISAILSGMRELSFAQMKSSGI